MSEIDLARKIIQDYASGLDRFSGWECQQLVDPGFFGEKLEQSQCTAIQEVLGYGRNGTVEKWERKKLSDVGFSRNFIDELAGPDGRNALRQRVRWLSYYFETKHQEPPQQRDMVYGELFDIGRFAEEAFPTMLRILRDGNEAPKVSDELRPTGGQLTWENSCPTYLGTCQDAAQAVDSSPLHGVYLAQLRSRSAAIVGQLGPYAKPAIGTLVAILQDDRKSITERISAAISLGKIGEKRGVIPALKKTVAIAPNASAEFRFYIKSLRVHSVEALSALSAWEAIPELIAISQDNDEDVRKAVKAFFGKFESSQGNDRMIIYSLLINLLDHERADVRSYAARALGRWGREARRAVELLSTALRDKDEDVRQFVVCALVQIGTKEAYDVLTHSREPVVSNTIEELLREDNVYKIDHGITLDIKKKRFCIWLLGEKGELGSMGPVVSFLGSSDVEAKRYAINAIGKIAVRNPDLRKTKVSQLKGMISGLIGTLDDKSATIRLTAAYALGGMGHLARKTGMQRSVVDSLRKRLAVDDPNVKAQAATALGRLGSTAKRAKKDLEQCALDQHMNVVEACINALDKIDGAGSTKPRKKSFHGSPDAGTSANETLQLNQSPYK